MFHENALWCPPSIPDKRGRKAIRYGFTAKDARIAVSTYVDEVDARGDLGYVVGKAEVVVFPNGGGPKRALLFRVFWVFKKIGSEWKIANQIWNEKKKG
jgi:ketosteroid isomerase-like protein